MNTKHSKNRVFGATGVLALVVAFSLSSTGRAVADQIKTIYAEVINGPGNPVAIEGKVHGAVDIKSLPAVQAQQAGPWSVDIGKMPLIAVGGQVQCAQSGNWTVQLDKASQCGCGPQAVLSSVEAPVIVRDVGQRTRTPFTSGAYSLGPFGGASSDRPEVLLASITVPGGKRFIAEHVMATVAPRNAGAFSGNLAAAHLEVTGGGGPTLQWVFVPLTNQGEVYVGRQLFVGNQPVKIVVPAGSTISLIGVQRGGADQASYGVISGYFEDL